LHPRRLACGDRVAGGDGGFAGDRQGEAVNRGMTG